MKKHESLVNNLLNYHQNLLNCEYNDSACLMNKLRLFDRRDLQIVDYVI